ncbi:hypothetical protein CDA63_11730 [Hymenobacter amundsenii]|uniref:Uncharacterized protein n=1 Tax=Hymenobacter amundsenii TaxID=2006685 RepID=A0A246FK15_9BACT|nr:hypothetical protein [Hymenobacter amundsenii]OWP62881.1 hypothetical protein CDA63_11730 [Hymenobacter amundsenii]
MNPLKGLCFRDWALIAAVLLIFWLAAGCVATRDVPVLLRPANPDSLQELAKLPAYLVPPPAQASAKQVERWTAAQTQALANVNAPASGKVKLKNVGNTDSDVSVQQGITGRQLTTAAVIVAIVGLVLWLKPWRT